jgi:hypothetical protein
MLAGTFSKPVSTSMAGKYHLLAGHALVTLKRWAAAERSYLRALYILSSNAVAESRDVAYRRWLLCCALNPEDRPALPTLPPFFPPNLDNVLEERSPTYYHLVRLCFLPGSASAMHAAKSAHGATWSMDKNDELADLVLQSYQRRQIRRLENVYRSIPISKVRTKTQSAMTGTELATDGEVWQLVTVMIESGDLSAVVAEADGVAYLQFVRLENAAHEKAIMERMRKRGEFVVRNRVLLGVLGLELHANQSVALAELVDHANTASAAAISGPAAMYMDVEGGDENLME